MFYNLHTHTYSADINVTEIVNRHPFEPLDIPYFSTGIHPWYIDEANLEEHLTIIASRLGEPACLALGECGLDKRIDVPMDLQAAVLKKQLFLAKQFQKPVILHVVAAFDELFAIVKNINPETPLIVHGFSKNKQVAKQLLDNGFYLSFGKYLLRNPGLPDVLANIPDNRFFLETDTTDESIYNIYAKAAFAKSVEIEQIKNMVANNFKKVFGNG